MSVMSVDTSIANLIGLESGRYPVSRCKHEVGAKSFMKTIGKQILDTQTRRFKFIQTEMV